MSRALGLEKRGHFKSTKKLNSIIWPAGTNKWAAKTPRRTGCQNQEEANIYTLAKMQLKTGTFLASSIIRG